MHPNPVFRSSDHAKDIAFARNRAFGTLAISADPVPMLAHVPFLLSPDGGEVLLHLVRSNPIARALAAPLPARLAVTGPDGYVSPDWYGVRDQVPTWNYVAVHLTGRLEKLPQDKLSDVLSAQSAAYEARLAPKPVWTMDKVSPEALARLLRMIVPCRLVVEEIDATWKLAQNKDEAARLGAAGEIADGFGSELESLAELMRTPPDL